jgi:hypothetical protein
MTDSLRRSVKGGRKSATQSPLATGAESAQFRLLIYKDTRMGTWKFLHTSKESSFVPEGHP